MRIPFNRSYSTGNEINTMIKAAMEGQISGNGVYTRKCHCLLEKMIGFNKEYMPSFTRCPFIKARCC
jgi:dTDP-4-amino-4,6-dideoxygalactose transaminase